MNLNQIKYFVAVAEHRSFTKAAVQYYLSQTAITQQIHALETAIGIQLIDRNSRPISLTPAGKVFLNEAKAILERMDTALSKTREASTGIVGTLRIGYTKGYERSSLVNHLRSFHHEYPGVLVTCHRSDTDTLAAGLLNNEYDIIFTWDSTNLRQENQTELRVVERVPFVVALYGAHPLARRQKLTRADLHNETILFMSPSRTGNSFGDAHFIDLYQKAGYQPNILLRSSDLESILMMVAAEEGISIMPSYCINHLTDTDNLAFIPLKGEDEYEEILAAWRKDDDSSSLKHFLEQIG